jgi:Fe-S-cluster containining protein
MQSLIESINEIKETSLSEYCLDECEISCCYLEDKMIEVTKDQLGLLYEDELRSNIIYMAANILGTGEIVFEQLLKIKIDRLKDEGIVTELVTGQIFGLEGIMCPKYHQEIGVCTIYGNSHRPEACGKFPIYHNSYDGVLMDPRCPFILENWEEIIDNLSQRHPHELSESHRAFTILTQGDSALHPVDAFKYRNSLRKYFAGETVFLESD